MASSLRWSTKTTLVCFLVLPGVLRRPLGVLEGVGRGRPAGDFLAMGDLSVFVGVAKLRPGGACRGGFMV